MENLYLEDKEWEYRVDEALMRMRCNECKEELYDDDYFYEIDGKCLCEDCYLKKKGEK